MQTTLAPEFRGTAIGREAEAVLRNCVHCGFCTATCPTYQLLGDELDGPRGRIYLIKQVFEGAAPTRVTQQHLDRCLTCRSCESTCPSGVAYGRLAEAGRRVVDERVRRPIAERAQRWMLREGLTSRWFAPALRLGQLVRPLLPQVLKDKVPPRSRAQARTAPARRHARKAIVPEGCVQPALAPDIGAATRRMLDAAGIEAVAVPRAGCCGAIRAHLGDHEGGRKDMRRNIDAWWPLLDRGEADMIVIDASGCSAMVKDYAHALADDPAYAQKAAAVAAAARDLTELLPEIAEALRDRLPAGQPRRLAFHPPCTLQHGQRIRGVVERTLAGLGFEVSLPADSHLCCGSAGTYSVLQPALAGELRDRKLAQLQAGAPDVIVSANIGCIQHLQAGTATPVRHWVEVVDETLASAVR
jgi:glycolate oxidase iron-sulfur subunit